MGFINCKWIVFNIMDWIVIIWSIVSLLLVSSLGLLVWFMKSFITKVESRLDLNQETDFNLSESNNEIKTDLKLAIVNLTNQLEKQALSCDIRMNPVLETVKNHSKTLEKHSEMIFMNQKKIEEHSKVLNDERNRNN